MSGHSELTEAQRVVIYPSFAYFDQRANAWKAPIRAFVFRDGCDSMRQRMFLRLLQQVLKTEEEYLKASDVFEERIRGFLQVPQRNRSIVFDVGQSQPVCGKSRRSGHVRVSTTLEIDSEAAVPSSAAARPGTESCSVVACRVILPPHDSRQFSAHLTAIPPSGVSVISDIDDTLKISQVAHRDQLLHNTFLNPFATVPGMSQLYQQWARGGACFHYVSSSPWQLFQPLAELLRSTEFPAGSFHLRAYRFGDPSVLRLFTSRKRNKYKIIKSLFRMFPKRRFVLVGDSGEMDPEVYGKVARKFPKQIERILVRRVEGHPWTRYRAARAFRGIPRKRWQTFRVPTQIRDIEF